MICWYTRQPTPAMPSNTICHLRSINCLLLRSLAYRSKDSKKRLQMRRAPSVFLRLADLQFQIIQLLLLRRGRITFSIRIRTKRRFNRHSSPTTSATPASAAPPAMIRKQRRIICQKRSMLRVKIRIWIVSMLATWAAAAWAVIGIGTRSSTAWSILCGRWT